MQKITQQVIDQSPPERKAKSSAAITILMGLLLSPLIYEAAILGTARWHGMTGAEPHVATPMIDTLNSGLQSASHDLRLTVAPLLHNLPWNPTHVVIFGIGWASIAALLLRR